MSKYGYRDLEELYESIDLTSNPYSDKNFAPSGPSYQADKLSYGTKGLIPTTVPGNAGTAYSMGELHTSFEEEDERVIAVGLVNNKINDLLQDATDRDTVRVLTELLIFLNQYNDKI
jgi:hypothetical protein